MKLRHRLVHVLRQPRAGLGTDWLFLDQRDPQSTARVLSPRRNASRINRSTSAARRSKRARPTGKKATAASGPPICVASPDASRNPGYKNRAGHRSDPDSSHTPAHPTSDPWPRRRADLTSLANSAGYAGQDRPRTAPGPRMCIVATARSTVLALSWVYASLRGMGSPSTATQRTPFVFYTEKISSPLRG